jgi:hypothetical protein
MRIGASTGIKIGAPIDVTVHANGAIFFSNVMAGVGTLGSGAYRFDPASGTAMPSLTGHTFPPGTGSVALSADGSTLLVFGLGRFTLTAAGQFSSGGVDPVTTGQDGAVAVDCANNIYVVTHAGGKVVSFTEAPIAVFPAARDLAFGGADGKNVILLDQRAISLVSVNVPGVQ